MAAEERGRNKAKSRAGARMNVRDLSHISSRGMPSTDSAW